MKTVDVIIPVYKPDEKFKKLMLRLSRQSYPVNKIILINTERKYFDAFFADGFLKRFDNITLRHITKEEFDHGGTRRMGVELSGADYFICMTDDAVPADTQLVEELIKPLITRKASVAYARQLAGRESDMAERISRRFNYPPQSRIKTLADRGELGIKSFFCSNVCAAYDRATYDALGGFEAHMIFNEDMVYAGRLQDAGGSIAYVAEARVIHAHHYSAAQQFSRNFDLGVSQAQFPELFGGVSSGSEGIKLVCVGCAMFFRHGAAAHIPAYLWMSACKLLGYRLGKTYKLLPAFLIRSFSMNKIYWRNE